MYASSEDEISEEEEVSGTLCYPPYDINRALDSLQNIMDGDLLEVLVGDSSHTLRPASPAVTVEALPSEDIYQPMQSVATLPFTPPAVVVETLSSSLIHEPSYLAEALQITPPGAKKPRLSAHQPSLLAAAHKPSSSGAAQPPSHLAADQQSSSSAENHQPLSPVATEQSSSIAAAYQHLTPSPAATEQSSSIAAAHQHLSLAVVQQHSSIAAAHEPSPSMADQQPLSPVAVHLPSPSLAAQQPSEAAHLTLQGLIDKVRDWSEYTTGFAAPNFTRKLKSKKSYNNRSLPIHYFFDMFPSEIIDIIVANTNSYASFMHSLNWTPTNATEIKAYLGMIIMMGLHPLSELELYWSSDPFYHNPIIAAVMPCKRFKKLTENLHLSDRATEVPRTHSGYDKLCKIRPIMDILNKSFQENCIGTHMQSIDESMVKFKGRSTLKQYMPQKPIKRGYKVWARCDSETGYLYQFNVYIGKSETQEDGDGGLGYKVVMDLCRTVESGTLVAFDNFFTSLPLLEMLHQKSIFSVGTVRQNRKGLPPRLLPQKGDKNENKLKAGEFMVQYAAPIAVIKWRDTKDVYVCTTAFEPKAVVTIQRTQKDGSKAPITCPLAIEQYTKCMGGVDRLDHFRSSYSIGRKSTKKNWIRLFWFMFEVACINAYIVYTITHTKTSSSHRDFRLKLARGLIDNFTIRLRVPPVFKNKKGGQFGVSDDIRLNNVGVHMPCEGTRKRCRYCSTRQKPQRSKIMCKICQVPLCAAPCFDDFHC